MIKHRMLLLQSLTPPLSVGCAEFHGNWSPLVLESDMTDGMAGVGLCSSSIYFIMDPLILFYFIMDPLILFWTPYW